MQHSKTVKIFNLATSITDYGQHFARPSYQGLEQKENLFDQETAEQVKITSFEQQRTYDYVGVKELKAYYDRNRRVSKERRKDTLNMSMGMSRQSAISKQEDEFYSKWQVLQQVESKIEATIMPNASAISTLQPTMRENMISIPFHATSPSRFRPKRSEFRLTDTSSVIKLRNNFQNYEDRWRKEEEKAEIVKKGFPSLLRLASQSRSISVRKALNQQKFKKENIPSRMWMAVLHEEIELRNIYNKPVARCQRGKALNLAGKSKLKLEKEWLNDKGDQGFRFQLIKNQKRTE